MHFFFLAVESGVSNIPDSAPAGGSTNQSSARQATGALPSSASSEQNSRFDQYKYAYVLYKFVKKISINNFKF